LLTFSPTSALVPTGESFEVRVDDHRRGYATQTFHLAVAQPPSSGHIPVITSTPSGPVYVNVAWQYQVVAHDPDGQNLYYSIQSSAPPSNQLSIDANGLVTWTPHAEGTYDVTVSVSDHIDGTHTQTFQLTVGHPNHAPVFYTTPTPTDRVGYLWTYSAGASDADGDTVTYSLDAASPAAGMLINPATGTVTWTPTKVGAYNVTVTADDGKGGTQTQTFSLNVVNSPPQITSQPTGPARVGETWQYAIVANDPDGHFLSYVLASPQTLPQGMSFDAAHGVPTWQPAAAGVAVDVQLQVNDGFGGQATQSFTIRSEAAATSNDAPVIRSLPTTTTRLGDVYRYDVDAYDPNGQPLTYSLSAAPNGMAIDAGGHLTWRPSALGDADVTVVVSDGQLQTSQSFTLHVVPPLVENQPPTITSTPTGPALRDRAYEYQATATDPDGQSVTWSVDTSAVPPSVVGDLNMNSSTGLLTWTPHVAGDYHLTITANDGHGGTNQQAFTLTVLQNAPPVITSQPALRTNVNQAYSYTVTASDPNTGDTLTYTLPGNPVPGQVTFNGTTHHLQWTPTQVGLYDFVAAVSDGTDETDQSFEVRVVDPADNQPPHITSNPPTTIQVGTHFLHQVTVSDQDGDAQTFTLVSGPAGMTMDTGGLIDWTPTGDQLGQQSFDVLVTDAGGLTDEKTFHITVQSQATNHAPTFTTTPHVNAVADLLYVYNAAATDPDGDTIVFQLVTAPAGMDVDPQSGRVQWRPTVDDVGDHTMTLRVVDARGLFTDQTVTLHVRSVDRYPQFNSDPGTQTVVNQQYTYNVNATDSDGDAVFYSLPPALAAQYPTMHIDQNTGVFTWTPTVVGVYQIEIDVRDEIGFGVAQVFNLNVLATAPNHPPVFTNSPGRSADNGTVFTWDADATDPDGDNVSFTLAYNSRPTSEVTFNTTTGLFRWSVPAGTSLIGQQFTFEIHATDGHDDAVERFDVLVTEANVPPHHSGITDRSVVVGQTFRYDAQATC
jgi:hypothetical protein